jgi:HAMP domain-containing protein
VDVDSPRTIRAGPLLRRAPATPQSGLQHRYRLVRLWESQPVRGVHRNVVHPFNFLDWRERSRSFEHMAAILDTTMNLPAGFSFPNYKAELWTPLPLERSKLWNGGHFLGVVARLKPGVSMAQAQDEMTAIASQLSKENAFMNKNWSVDVFPALEDATEGVRLPLLVLLAAVGFVLLIACANVANLSLMRATGRMRKVAVRAALGSGRARIAVQLLSESLLLALAGWAAGLAIAHWGLKGLLAPIPAGTPLPRMQSIQLGGVFRHIIVKREDAPIISIVSPQAVKLCV